MPRRACLLTQAFPLCAGLRKGRHRAPATSEPVLVLARPATRTSEGLQPSLGDVLCFLPCSHAVAKSTIFVYLHGSNP